MDITRDFSDSEFVITGYQNGQVLINNEPYSKSLIVCPDRLITTWSVHHIHQLKPSTLSVMLDLQPEVVLIGTGEKMCCPMGVTMAWFAKQNIGLETMSTAAVCRTFGFLVSEGRRVAAAFIFPD